MLKKIKLSFLCLALLMSVTTGYASADFDYYDYYKSIKLTIGQSTAVVNGVSSPIDQAPYIKASRTMIPLRFISETLKAYIDWQPSTKTVLIEADNGTTVKVIIGSKTAYVNNKPQTLEAPAEIRGGRAFVPLRFVGEALGMDVNYNGSTKTITLTQVDTSDWEEYVEPVTGTAVFFPDDWSISSEGSSLIIDSPEDTSFTFEHDNRSLAEVLKANKSKLLSEGWKLASESATMLKLTKPDPNVQANTQTYIVSAYKADSGCLVSYIETNSVAQEQDLAVIDKITPGAGI